MTDNEPQDDEADRPSNSRDAPDGDSGGDGDVSQLQAATWLVVGGNDRGATLTATAFAVDDRLLATNAHVVEGPIGVYDGSPAWAGVVQHETGEVRTITRVWTHPGYNPLSQVVVTPDVALVEVDGDVSETLAIAPDGVLQGLEVFDDVSLCGFPGTVAQGIDFGGILTTGELHPRTTCLEGSISALRPYDPGESATPQNTYLIQYDLPVVPGTNGSAVVSDSDDVIGVNALGFTPSRPRGRTVY